MPKLKISLLMCILFSYISGGTNDVKVLLNGSSNAIEVWPGCNYCVCPKFMTFILFSDWRMMLLRLMAICTKLFFLSSLKTDPICLTIESSW
jgi:hypothetical protein